MKKSCKNLMAKIRILPISIRLMITLLTATAAGTWTMYHNFEKKLTKIERELDNINYAITKIALGF